MWTTGDENDPSGMRRTGLVHDPTLTLQPYRNQRLQNEGRGLGNSWWQSHCMTHSNQRAS